MTRAFGWSISSTTLIPFADLMNHGMDTIDHNIVHLGYELEPAKKHPKYRVKKSKINLKMFLEEEAFNYSKKYTKENLEGSFLKNDYKYVNPRNKYVRHFQKPFLEDQYPECCLDENNFDVHDQVQTRKRIYLLNLCLL